VALRSWLQSKGSSDVRNARYIAIVCGVLMAAPGCGKDKIVAPKVETDNFKDNQYSQSLMGINSQSKFEGFLKGLDPANRAKYITKSAEEAPSQVYTLKSVYEKFTSDPSPEVAAAAKEALTKVPTPEEFQAAQKEEMEKLKPK
jgi:hypothetical protein